MKISNVSQIALSPAKYLTRDQMSKYIELPCLEACLKLYDLNIHTYSSGCNKINYDNAHIELEYRYLSEENKAVADELVKNGLAIRNNYNGEEYIIITVKTSLKDDVKVVSNKLLEIVNMFSYQDILYGFMSIEEFKKREAEFTKEFEYINGELIPKEKFDSQEELENRKANILFNIEDCLEEAIDYGRVDLEEGTVWENNEFFDKHIAYVDEMKGLKKK